MSRCECGYCNGVEHDFEPAPEFDLPAAIRKLAEMEGPAKQITGQPFVEGRIVPFQVLRVPVTGFPEDGWAPEPNMEKAGHRVFWALPYEWQQRVLHNVLRGGQPTQETFSAALAWAQEQ